MTTMMFCCSSNKKKGGAVPGIMFLPVPSLLLSTMSFLAMVRLKSFCFGQFCGNRLHLPLWFGCCIFHGLSILFRLCRRWVFDNPFNSHLVLCSVIYLCISSIYETDLENFGFKAGNCENSTVYLPMSLISSKKIIQDHP